MKASVIMEKFEAIRLALMACDFWQLTANAAEELAQQGNHCSLSYIGWGWPSKEEWENHTKWSDINIGQPVLFNFYHGIELSLKALIVAKGQKIKNNHQLSKLVNQVGALYKDEELTSFYSKYVVLDKLPKILYDFCRESDMTMDLYFQSLKYPTSTKGVEFNHSVLRYNEDSGIELFSEIRADVVFIRDKLKHVVSMECRDEFA